MKEIKGKTYFVVKNVTAMQIEYKFCWLGWGWGCWVLICMKEEEK